ncbi:MAG TPA: cytochrome c [Phenylobacterium sp.]|uniref:c-type cytochrome n=1 Tax=Phenylobacterium sp. TaxID=1871053 RepID=UPI002B47AF6A|nr:cytochrome c [Phenylobacterium sp.]HKR90001.1 cytochrome c [Phenylobacterium sp.]
MRTRATGLVLVLGAGLLAGSAQAQQPQASTTWRDCCGAAPWSQQGAHGRGMMGQAMPGAGMMGGGYPGGMGSSAARNHVAMMGNVPAPYADVENPLPRTTATIERGAAVYAANCASCHGATGLGDGPAARNLSPKPANLAWLSQMPMSRWDPFMYWTIAEGGAQFGTPMPAFKGQLSKADIWAVTAYIQAHLPARAAKK